MGGGHQAHVELELPPLAAQALQAPLLQDAQELDLQLGLHFADLVEEQGPALGGLEASLAGALGVGERARLVPEELGLEQGRGDRSAVHAHQRAPGALALVVHELGEELLARAALSPDQNVRLAAGRRPRQLDRVAKGLARADQALGDRRRAELAQELAVLATQAVLVEHLAHQRPQLGRVDRGGEEVEDPGLQRLARALDRRVGGEDHEGQRLRAAALPLRAKQAQAVGVREALPAEHQGDLGGERALGAGAVGGLDEGLPGRAQGRRDPLRLLARRVHQQHRRAHRLPTSGARRRR